VTSTVTLRFLAYLEKDHFFLNHWAANKYRNASKYQGRNIHGQQPPLLPARNEEEDVEWTEFEEIDEAVESLYNETMGFEDPSACQAMCLALEKISGLYPLMRTLEAYTGEFPSEYEEDVPPSRYAYEDEDSTFRHQGGY